ncbi:uncharacterized protein [Panulirus ornatus]|uniref:uncharacterized protein n=1 Tax=Panulirus ornatus TaxID=150431 RepID=UPI003A83E241
MVFDEDEDRWTTRQFDDFNKTDADLKLPDTPTKQDTALTDVGWPFQFLISTDKRLFKSCNKQADASTQATLWRPSELKDSKKWMKSSHFKSAHQPDRLYLAKRTGGLSKMKINKFSTFPRRRKKLESKKATHTWRKNIKRPYENGITRNERYERKDRDRRSSGTDSDMGLTDTDSTEFSNGANTATRPDKNQDRRQTGGQEDTTQSLKIRTEKRTAWTDYNVDLGTSVEVEPAHENPKEDLVAEESLSAPIFVTIVQRNEEADYFTDKYPPYPPPPPPSKYHHKPEYYPPPPPPPKYQSKPEYHSLPIPPYLPPPPPPIYHPVPAYHPPPPPRYHQDDAYHHFEVKAKYYHASDYNEPSYHKPKFFDESLYHHDIEYHPPPPPPLPLPKYKRDYSSHPPVYHPKIHHEPKHQHSYLPPPPSPPKTVHKPDHYPDPEYHHHEVQYHHSAPANYEYHLDVYDRKDNYEPHYQDHSKRSINHQAPQLQTYLDKEEPIEEVKHEYRKGSRAFEHSASHLTAVHVNGDNLYKDAPPHGFIKAKYETSAAYHPEPLYPPLPPPTSIHQRYNEAPLPLPPHPPASHHEIKLDNSPKTRHLLPAHPNPMPSPEPFHDVPLPAPLPSLEDVDPLIFEPIFSYNDYFDAATKFPLKKRRSISSMAYRTHNLHLPSHHSCPQRAVPFQSLIV